jgi:hypothetical protein
MKEKKYPATPFTSNFILSENKKEQKRKDDKWRRSQQST